MVEHSYGQPETMTKIEMGLMLEGAGEMEIERTLLFAIRSDPLIDPITSRLRTVRPHRFAAR